MTDAAQAALQPGLGQGARGLEAEGDSGAAFSLRLDAVPRLLTPHAPAKPPPASGGQKRLHHDRVLRLGRHLARVIDAAGPLQAALPLEAYLAQLLQELQPLAALHATRLQLDLAAAPSCQFQLPHALQQGLPLLLQHWLALCGAGAMVLRVIGAEPAEGLGWVLTLSLSTPNSRIDAVLLTHLWDEISLHSQTVAVTDAARAGQPAPGQAAALWLQPQAGGGLVLGLRFASNAVWPPPDGTPRLQGKIAILAQDFLSRMILQRQVEAMGAMALPCRDPALWPDAITSGAQIDHVICDLPAHPQMAQTMFDTLHHPSICWLSDLPALLHDGRARTNPLALLQKPVATAQLCAALQSSSPLLLTAAMQDPAGQDLAGQASPAQPIAPTLTCHLFAPHPTQRLRLARLLARYRIALHPCLADQAQAFPPTQRDDLLLIAARPEDWLPLLAQLGPEHPHLGLITDANAPLPQGIDLAFRLDAPVTQGMLDAAMAAFLAASNRRGH